MRLTELEKALGRASQRPRQAVTVMPDLIADQLISLPDSTQTFLSKAGRVLRRGGGNYLGAKSRLTRGGCAANCAAYLSMLHVPVHMVGKTGELGPEILKLSSDQSYLDTSRLKTDGRLGVTAALETRSDGQVINLMITDPGSAGEFSVEDLESEDYEMLKKSFLVGLFSWNLNPNGTELIQEVSGFCHRHGVRVYLDIGDPNTRLAFLPELTKILIDEASVDYLSLNENELRCLGKSMNVTVQGRQNALDIARRIVEQASLEIDFHTWKCSATISQEESITCPAFDVQAQRSTGAGDAWNAGNVFAILNGFAPELRLMMANLLGAAHVASQSPQPPSMGDLRRFMRRMHLRRRMDLP